MSKYKFDPSYRRIFVQDYAIEMIIGIFEFEKNNKQTITFNIDIYVPLIYSTSKNNNDNIDDVLDYNIIADTIHRHTSNTSYNLQETLCDNILHELLSNDKIHAVYIEMYKNNIYHNAKGVGISRYTDKLSHI
jgi:7,8-dihydroneopterin aldolase/epimerase/oxygenase